MKNKSNNKAHLQPSGNAASPASEPSELPESPELKRGAAVRCSDLVRQPSQKNKSLPNSHQKVLYETLAPAACHFSSLSVLFSHLEAHPKTLGELDRRTRNLLKPLHVQWQKDDRPEITWRETWGFAAQVYNQVSS